MKKEIEIKYELSLPDKTFEELKDKIENSDTLETGKFLAEILKVKNMISINKTELNEKVNAILAELNEYEDKINVYIKDVLKPRYLDYVEKTGKIITKEKMNQKTFLTTTTEEFVYELPKGVQFKNGTNKFIYNEDVITDEKFYSKTLKKVAVKKAWKEGEIAFNSIKVEKGQPTISIVDKTVIASNIKEVEND